MQYFNDRKCDNLLTQKHLSIWSKWNENKGFWGLILRPFKFGRAHWIYPDTQKCFKILLFKTNYETFAYATLKRCTGNFIYNQFWVFFTVVDQTNC